MKSRFEVLGHAVHPMLIVFPLGLFSSAVAFDYLYRATRNKVFAAVGYWNVVGGLIGGMVAGIFGLIDWLAIPGGTRAKSVGLWHGLGNLLVTSLFAMSWMGRRNEREHLPSGRHFALELIAGSIVLVTAWLGGELVERLGISVDRGANVNAPSSLAARDVAEIVDFRGTGPATDTESRAA